MSLICWVWQCDVAILPSHREGFGALLEAAACGLPLLGTDVPGVREIVHGYNGRCLPEAIIGTFT